MAFNDAQKTAIRHREGPMLVLAGPGSGKTTVITNRVRYLTEKAGVDPSHILVITFTRAAAREMKERYEQIAQAGCSRVSFGTFHSVFFLILKLAYRYKAADIVREEQRIQYMKEMLVKCDLEVEDEGEFISSVLSEISMVKGELMDMDHYYAKNCSEDMFRQLYRGYEAQLRRNRLLDFDDMLVMCYELFKERKDILSAWQDKYRYILIDEFQDINRIQYEIVKMLALPGNNLFIVGDDDQSIYRFRGAKPELMLGFERDYPDAKKILLDTNYRCSRQIVEAAGRVISHNRTRFPKEIKAARGNGHPVIIKAWQEPMDETLGIVTEIRDYASMGISYNDMAVLYRTNVGPRLLISKLMEYNIPFYMRDAVPNLYEHWIAGNVISYIRAALGDLSRSNVLQIINRPKRYVSRDALEGQQVSWESVKSFYQDKNWMMDRIEQLEYDLTMLRNMAPAAAVNYIRKAVEYDEYIREYAQSRRMKPEELFEVLDQLQESAAGFKTYEHWFIHMQEYKEQLKKQAADRDAQRQGVSLMTMHSAKGLEFRVVYILDANEGITPHHKAVLDQDPDLIIGWGSTFGESTLGPVSDWNDRGIHTYIVDNSASGGDNPQPRTVERLYNDIENFGKIFGIEDRAQAMINDMKARAAKIAERVDTLPEEEKMTVLTVQMVYENEFFGRTSTDFTHDLIEKAGGICLDEAFGKQSIENLIKLNPDVIVVINRTDSPAQEKIDSLKANPSLASVPAVANDRFVSLDYVDFYGGNYETIDTIEHLAQGFYPDLFQ